MRVSLYEFCTQNGCTKILDQWHQVKNTALEPQSVSYGSKKKVWWQCDKGHSWQAAVFSRTGGNAGCPVCTGKTVLQGCNDLATTHPELILQWHPEKNGALNPETVSSGSHQKVWWLCEKGHQWQAQINSRASGSGCPVCLNRKLIPGVNDLATLYPEIAAQWHPTKNAGLTPADVVSGSRKKVWWLCGKGHEWQTSVTLRANGSICPVCAGKVVLPGENDLASTFPMVASQWAQDKDGSLAPEAVSAYSNRKAWWRCELGHEYIAAVAARTMHGSGCPYCAGRKVLEGFNDLQTCYPLIAAQWYQPLNGALMPTQVTPGSRKKVWWQCAEGHVWKAVVSSRTCPRKHSCPVCAGKVKKGYSNIGIAAVKNAGN